MILDHAFDQEPGENCTWVPRLPIAFSLLQSESGGSSTSARNEGGGGDYGQVKETLE
jgi:hypothetical protein